MSVISSKIDAIYRTSQTSKMPVSLIWMSTKQNLYSSKKAVIFGFIVEIITTHLSGSRTPDLSHRKQETCY